ncbi:YccS family putative transporter [Uliginosibacterium sp. TH139]|uniref:YccS family putative transporter n=1 Tax=Uliginosibacterium sp. TH139 TaxID=2067453 RepID=UPI000C7C11B9|nr:YccS family putative transporter [Uliginosibacterium sp. TH139]PLK48139.1 TIGR01666 family membrane protein [Uliginosibacterium sp. TH139]
MQTSFFELWRQFWAHDKTSDSVKVALALGGVVWLCLALDRPEWLIGPILGVIAAALAETEDRPLGRLLAVLVTLSCFAATAFSVRLLFAWPWLFVCGLLLSTFGFVMLGAISERYARVASASLILGIYAMLSASRPGQELAPIWHEPLQLLAGAAWYEGISLVWVLAFAARPARQILASVYLGLASYLALKAKLLEPIPGRHPDALRLALAEHNSLLVQRMNRARQVLLGWMKDGQPRPRSARFLKWYFLAQDIHERASSSHQSYTELSRVFARSDILFRCAHLMSLQGEACAKLARAIALDKYFNYGRDSLPALDELGAALRHVQASTETDWRRNADPVADLTRNLTTIDRQLSNAGNPDALLQTDDTTLRDSNPASLREALQRIRMQFTPKSGRFRHGLRLSLALAAGYGLLHLLNLPQGYWVMLTTVFVLQPTYSDTWKRLGQRVSGTMLGLVGGWAFLHIFPQDEAQLGLAVVSGVAFFFWRADRYMLATASITVLVLLCFNQLGSSYALIWPRLLDTVLGALLAGGAVALILPDWQGRRLHLAMSKTLARSSTYLNEVLAQYNSGKDDHLGYRIARRDAHNADAELSLTLSAMLGEPDQHRLTPEQAFHFLTSSHTLLAYISALGAHREKISQWQHGQLVAEAGRQACDCLARLATAFEQRQVVTAEALPLPSLTELDEIPSDTPPQERRIIRQLALVSHLLPELAAVSANMWGESCASR